MKQVTATVGAWFPEATRMTPAQMRDAPAPQLVMSCTYSSADMSIYGWVKVGQAQVTIDLLPPEDLMAQQVAALRKEQGELMNAVNDLEGQIQQLLAIEHDAPEAAA